MTLRSLAGGENGSSAPFSEQLRAQLELPILLSLARPGSPDNLEPLEFLENLDDRGLL